jgi:hypothetical protein
MSEAKQPSIENKQPAIENNSQSAQNKPSDADKKEVYPYKFPIQDAAIDSAIKLLGLFKVEKSTKIKEWRESSGFLKVSFKGGFSTGSFWLDKIDTFIPNLISDLEKPQKDRIMKEIDDQAWEEKFKTGDSLFIYHGGSGQEKNFGLRLTPKQGESRKFISYKMGTLATTFTLAQPFIILEKTRKSFLSDKTTEEIVYLPATYGPKQQEELNQMKIAFFTSAMKNLMIQDVNAKRSLEDRGDDEDEFNRGDPYKQLKN